MKLGKMFFISLQELFSFLRKSKFRILDIQCHDVIKCLSIKQEVSKQKSTESVNEIWAVCHITKEKKNFYLKILQNLRPEN